MIDDKQNKIEQALERLQAENAFWRRQTEEVKIILRHRARMADGLTIKGSVKEILNERDEQQRKVSACRVEMQVVLKQLIDGNHEDAIKELNDFLYKKVKK